jgi:hypothetical protein
LFVLGGVVAIGRCLSALELFGLARNELAGRKCNAVLLCIGFKLHSLIQISVSICAEVSLMRGDISVPQRYLLTHISVLFDVGFWVSQNKSLRFFAAKHRLRL